MDPKATVKINGLNDAPKGRNGVIMAVPYMTTQVDKEFWDMWHAVHAHPRNPFQPLKSGAIFVAKDEKDAKAIYREREDDKTGLEQLNPDEHRVKTATED